MPKSAEYHPMGGPADVVPPVLLALMPIGSVWRGLAHGEERVVDMGDIGVLAHLRRGLECYLFAADKRMVFPWPPNEGVKLDRHNHIRVGDPTTGKVKVTFAPTE